MSDEHATGSGDGPPVAGEYVLGVLNAAERRAFEARMAQDPALRSEVEYWERRLGVLASELKPIDPPPRVWANIESALSARPVQSGFWHHLPFWRWAAIGSAAVAVCSQRGMFAIGVAKPERVIAGTMKTKAPRIACCCVWA